ncbi:uncharacterized protein LOC134451607 [Engraulis encrasicolus]|uniref:uncharacterized protein LOC134451607 n=1 Tax=Engraulis encrasicolus TaxID=184585 RepID=UPI002FD3ED13
MLPPPEDDQAEDDSGEDPMDYDVSRSDPGFIDSVLEENTSLRFDIDSVRLENSSLQEERDALRRQVESLTLGQRFGIRCLIGSDDDIGHYTSYADTVVILDCTELHCQCPSDPVLQNEVYSHYKSHCTLKGLIGIAPHGPVTFISQLYAGSISDKQITMQSGVLDLLRPGMAVMVDRGFLIDDVVPCKIYRPPFLGGRPQMSGSEVKETQAIASLRVHVERSIRRVKEHKIFSSEIPLSLFGSINQLYTVACLLTNFEHLHLVKAWAKRHEV